MYGTWATGFATSLSLILAIGAQNAFVLREGLARQHVFWLCLFCGASDAVLIATGVAGFGATTALWPAMPRVLAVGGAVFLFVYGTSRFLAAYRGDHRLHISGRSASLGATLAVAAAFTWGNPHVYLDTLGLLGAISASYEGSAKWAFGLGAIMASFVFFFALGYGARLLAPVMQTPRAWVVLDVIIGLVMWWIAASLVF